VDITADLVKDVASRLSGGAGPGGTDAVDLKNWLLRFGEESELLRTSLARLAEWLANEHPPWVAYRALMACRLVALDKSLGVRPVGIGEVYRRLMAKCVLKAVGHQATDVAGNLNLCAGLPAGIEGAIHGVRQATAAPPIPPVPPEPPDPPEPLEPPGADPMEGLYTQPLDPPAEPDVPTPADPSGALLVDARNGFNELGRRAML
jgi:hypothetical protein